MYPLTLLKMAYNQPMLVELKNGETYNGNLASCDTWMNLYLRGEVICTSKDGENFWKMPEVYIRGSMIKYLRLPDDVMDIAKQQEKDGGKRRRRDDRGGGDRGGNRGQ